MGLAILFIWSRPDWTPSSLTKRPSETTQETRAPLASRLTPPTELLKGNSFVSAAASILSPSLDGNLRRKLLHQLIVAGLPAAEALLTIARTPLPLTSQNPQPHSLHEMKVKFERSLRITALEALDKLAIDHPQIAAKLSEVAAEQTDPMISFLAQVSVTGIQQGRPGKLVRMIDRVVN